MADGAAPARQSGVTIFLTTHYIEEAEEMADRIGVISGGRILIVEEKTALMNKLGTTHLTLTLQDKLQDIPASLEPWKLVLANDNSRIVYAYDAHANDNGIARLMRELDALDIAVKDIETHKSSLEEIFVTLVHAK